MSGPTAALLPDGRLHLQHGPIDIVISADGARDAVEDAFEAAAGRFASVLNELVEELPRLRRPMDDNMMVSGLVASRMVRAVKPHATNSPSASDLNRPTKSFVRKRHSSSRC